MLNKTSRAACGSVESKPVYYYYEKQSNGSYILDNIDADNCQIFQTSEISPQIQLYNGTIMTLLFSDLMAHRYDIFLPENSIIQEYNPNMR